MRILTVNPRNGGTDVLSSAGKRYRNISQASVKRIMRIIPSYATKLYVFPDDTFILVTDASPHVDLAEHLILILNKIIWRD